MVNDIVLAMLTTTASPKYAAAPPPLAPNLITSPVFAAPTVPKVVPVPVTVLLL